MLLVNITELQSEFTKILSESTVSLDETCILTCETLQDDAKVSWLKDGKELKPSKRVKMVSENNIHKIIINDVTVEDAGKYTCIVGKSSTSAWLRVEGMYISVEFGDRDSDKRVLL